MDIEIREEFKMATETIIKLFNKVQNEDELKVMRSGIRNLINNFEDNFERTETNIQSNNRAELDKLKRIAELINS
jgi:hypothetical protein